jgi:hypothetical protein
MKLSNVAITCMAVMLAGCGSQPGLTSGEIAQIKGDLSYLKSAKNEQEALQTNLNDRIKALEAVAVNAPNSAFFDPAGGTGYQYISTNVSPIIVSFVDVSPIGDGAKIRLKVGNLTTATYTGVRLDVSYNTRIPEEATQVAAWSKKTRDVSANDASALAPGAWSMVEASLPGIKPDQLGYIVVKAHLDNLSLRTSY